MVTGMEPTTISPARLDFDPDAVSDVYERRGLDGLSDAQLFDLTARVVSIPRQEAANSFVLHAPLELMARRLLLPHVAPELRRAVRERLVWVAARYERAGEPVDPATPATHGSFGEARDALLAALVEGDLAPVDATATQLLERATLDEVMTLAEPTVDMLAAAGHAPIGFFLASRLATTQRAALTLLRPALRELARAPQLRVEWIRGFHTPSGNEAAFSAALARTPQLGLPGTDFIFPIVHQADEAGIARDAIDATMPADVTTAAAMSLRIAAHSMLQDDPEYAPYGWTHCMTLPQGVLEITPWLTARARAAAIAATYVVAFRAAEGSHALDPEWVPEPTTTGLLDALDADPRIAAGAWFHADDGTRARALPVLVGRAASHPDAHVVKYTYACLAAAARDRASRSLFLAAAASLVAWWSARADTAFRDDL